MVFFFFSFFIESFSVNVVFGERERERDKFCLAGFIFFKINIVYLICFLRLTTCYTYGFVLVFKAGK